MIFRLDLGEHSADSAREQYDTCIYPLEGLRPVCLRGTLGSRSFYSHSSEEALMFNSAVHSAGETPKWYQAHLLSQCQVTESVVYTI